MFSNKNNRYKILGALFVLASFSCSNCNNEKPDQEKSPQYDMVYEDHTKGYTFPQGVYFEYLFPNNEKYIEKIEEILIEFYKKGIVVYDSWYQPLQSKCVAPGETEGALMIVDPRFILRLNITDTVSEVTDFEAVIEPRTIGCGYYVARYKLVE